MTQVQVNQLAYLAVYLMSFLRKEGGEQSASETAWTSRLLFTPILATFSLAARRIAQLEELMTEILKNTAGCPRGVRTGGEIRKWALELQRRYGNLISSVPGAKPLSHWGYEDWRVLAWLSIFCVQIARVEKRGQGRWIHLDAHALAIHAAFRLLGSEARHDPVIRTFCSEAELSMMQVVFEEGRNDTDSGVLPGSISKRALRSLSRRLLDLDGLLTGQRPRPEESEVKELTAAAAAKWDPASDPAAASVYVPWIPREEVLQATLEDMANCPVNDDAFALECLMAAEVAVASQTVEVTRQFYAPEPVQPLTSAAHAATKQLEGRRRPQQPPATKKANDHHDEQKAYLDVVSAVLCTVVGPLLLWVIPRDAYSYEVGVAWWQVTLGAWPVAFLFLVVQPVLASCFGRKLEFFWESS